MLSKEMLSGDILRVDCFFRAKAGNLTTSKDAWSRIKKHLKESAKSIPNTGKAEICPAHKIGRVCPECIKEVLSGKRSAVA